MEYRGVHMMRSLSDCGSSATYGSEEGIVLRKGPWTEEEDSILVNYITVHGEGHWNSVARCAGLKRTGKSCRLRWLNYLRPNVRRGNISLQEQLLILELHCRWGNRWSKIAQQLPGRTDNEIKNYWRTRVVKQAKHLKCDVNSKQFRDALRLVWMPRLLERIRADSGHAHAHAHAHPHPQPSFFNSNPLAAGASLSEKEWSSWQEMEYSDVQAFEAVGDGFGGAELWTDENIWFLQQQLADDS